MAGTINSLGIGSGVLTSDIIEKLKANDSALTITPLTNKITLSEQKSSALDLLNSLLSTFKTSISALDDDTLYQKRSVSGTNDSVSVTADTGVSVQSFSITDVALAKNHVLESGSFSSLTSKVSTGSGTMSLAIDGKSFDIAYTSATTLDDLKTAINEKAGDKVKATTLQVGTNDYRLILTSVETGEDQVITLSDSASGSLNSSLYATSKTIKSDAFSASTDTVASGSGNLTIAMGSNNYVVTYDDTTTLDDLVTAINTAVNSTVASLDSNNKLVLKSTVSGSSAPLTLTDNSAKLDSKLTGYTTFNPLDEIQASSDASFKYNGIQMSRSSNEISDITVGVTIKLLNEDSDANIQITQDVDAVSSEISTMAQTYNSLMSQLDQMTLADTANNKVGIFNGDSSITNIRREITKLMTSVNEDGNSLSQYGIDLSQTGVMSFDSSLFSTKFKSDPTMSERFFSGYTSYDDDGNETSTQDGIFTQLNQLGERYIGSNGIISMLTDASKEETKTLTSNKTRTQALLDARYDSMTARFIEYDAIISKLNNQFSALSQQISMAVNGS